MKAHSVRPMAVGADVYRNHRTAESTLFFIVRPAKPGANTSMLLQLSTNTYNAYNNWGGFSLYGYHGRSKIQGNRVSFDRPTRGIFRNWELQFIVWAEQNGYTLDYAANSDLEFRPEMLEHYRLVLSIGHDEYWSAPMRDHLEAFIANGGNAAFFSGNSVCWQVRSEDDGRALVCWKQTYNQDPVYKTDDYKTLSTLWSHYLVDRPENQLTGVGFLQGGYHLSHGQFMDGSGGIYCSIVQSIGCLKGLTSHKMTFSVEMIPSSATSVTDASGPLKTVYLYRPIATARLKVLRSLQLLPSVGILMIVSGTNVGREGEPVLQRWVSIQRAERSLRLPQPTGPMVWQAVMRRLNGLRIISFNALGGKWVCLLPIRW